MHVHNDQPCTLVIGDVRIASGETKPVPLEWEARCEQLHGLGALRGHGGHKAEDRPSRTMTPAEIFAAMSESDRRAAIAAVMGDTGAADVSDQPAAQNDAVPDGAPADFHTSHHNKALAFVRKCHDAALLAALGNSESRESVLSAIIDRVQALETKAN